MLRNRLCLTLHLTRQAKPVKRLIREAYLFGDNLPHNLPCSAAFSHLFCKNGSQD